MEIIVALVGKGLRCCGKAALTWKRAVSAQVLQRGSCLPADLPGFPGGPFSSGKTS